MIYNSEKSLFPVVAVLGIILLTPMAFAYIHAQESRDNYFPVNSSPYNVPFQEWTQKWWQWYLSIPKQHNHNFESAPGYEPVDCSYNQNGSTPVFSIPYVLKEKGQPSATASCTVPQGKAIMVGIDNGLMDYGDPSVQPKTVEKITEMVKKTNEFPNEFEITLDGEAIPLTNEENNRVTSEPFYIILPENNIWNEAPGIPYLAVADGWYLLLKPLPAGNHTLHYTTGYQIPAAPIGPANREGYIQEVTYNLLVEP